MFIKWIDFLHKKFWKKKKRDIIRRTVQFGAFIRTSMKAILLTWFASFLKRFSKFMISPEQTIENCIIEKQNLIIIFWHPKCKPCQKLFFKIPYFTIKAHRKGYSLRICNIVEQNENCKTLDISMKPCVVVYKKGKLEKRITDINEINLFFQYI